MRTFINAVFIAGCLMISCNNNSKLKSLRTFNLEKFRKLQKNGQAELVNGDTIVEFYESNNEFVEVVKLKGKLNYSYYEYDKKSLHLIKAGKHFSAFPVGIEISYDENGEVVDEIDYDRSYTFSVDELINKMVKDYKLNINGSPNTLSVNRSGLKKGKPVYSIQFKPDEFGRGRVIEVDGTTGEVIRDYIANYIES